MKKYIVIASIIVFLLSISYLLIYNFREKQKKILIGKYIIDTEITNYNGYLIDDIKGCTLHLRKDGNFIFNKDYPFLYDSIGTWEPRKPGFDQWNWMYFKKKSYADNKSLIDIQFGDSWFETGEKIYGKIELASVTPKPGQSPIHRIYMKKMEED